MEETSSPNKNEIMQHSRSRLIDAAGDLCAIGAVVLWMVVSMSLVSSGYGGWTTARLSFESEDTSVDVTDATDDIN
jgi:hypothetical protein